MTLLCVSYEGPWQELTSILEFDFYRLEENYLGTAPRELLFILLEVSVQSYRSSADATFPLEWIALFESIVANFAMHRGMSVPALPKKQQPLLMLTSKQSID